MGMSRPLLEVIALSADDARAAEAGGADRLELVADMAAQGLTPSRETFARVREAVALPVRVMLRTAVGPEVGADSGPYRGFTSGGEAALQDLCAQAELLCAEGADQFVHGFLDGHGRADLPAVRALTRATGGRPWTFHRAVDRAPDRPALRERLAEVPGLDTYLTAGSANGVGDGLDTLYAEAARSTGSATGPAPAPGYRPRIMVGGGLRLDHVPGLAAAGVTAFHIGGAARVGGWDGTVSADAVREWRTALDRLDQSSGSPGSPGWRDASGSPGPLNSPHQQAS